MKIKMSLLAILLRQVMPANLIALLVGCLYVLFTRNVLTWQNWPMALFVLMHSIAIASILGRYRTPSFAFLYTRGYSRDELWLHKMLGTALSVLAVWLPVSLLLWLGIRSSVQARYLSVRIFP